MENKTIQLQDSRNLTLVVPDWCAAVYIEFLPKRKILESTTIKDLIRVTNEHLGLDITDKSRKQNLIKGRQMFYMLTNELQLSRTEVIKTLGFSHGLISVQMKKAYEILSVDKLFQAEFELLKQKVFDRFGQSASQTSPTA